MTRLAAAFAKPTTPISRGIARSGPAILSYGFRPFFLLAGIWAVLAMLIWLASLTTGLAVGGDYGSLGWHGHEMVFGYASAALAGFLLTAIPNWTGRLPVSGPPLALLVLVWLAGRLAMLLAGGLGVTIAAISDGAFLPLLALIAAREVIVGRNWKNLKIVIALGVLSAANLLFHLSHVLDLPQSLGLRLGVAAYVMLIAIVGGRIVPSFTRNWLSRQGPGAMPSSFDRLDKVSLVATGPALLLWSVFPYADFTGTLALLAAALQTVRLWRWRGWRAAREPLVLVLHLAYAFVPLGLLSIGLAAVGLMDPASALHMLTVGGIGGMTLAVMTRASLGHTGRPLAAAPVIQIAYLALGLAGLARPMAELLPDIFIPILAISGVLWILAFSLFLIVYTPILTGPRQG